ncbi:hypothetical protein M419DRAFT_7399 [Trichoderma reesei RUT C-30]|uniref:Uncharacterized protein n=1 Tax=Hypocrea jecorina (strain ATCC 56765 / BCRC 32924 / NRRL 11460 / Rut C-30) TaxID=1344414 RepID=A0A024SEI1_HYPJR|nr:hypothetical protein M419DRAFT_7399 [Trichoderma reesei RUT C-30]
MAVAHASDSMYLELPADTLSPSPVVHPTQILTATPRPLRMEPITGTRSQSHHTFISPEVLSTMGPSSDD